jgi:hypothetical protein
VKTGEIYGRMKAALLERFGERSANVTSDTHLRRPLTVICVEVKIGSILVSGTTYGSEVTKLHLIV